MAGFKDNFGAEVVLRVTCQRCGTPTYRRQIGYGTMDAEIANRHSALCDQFERIADGWKVIPDIGWCCPKCVEQYNALINSFKNGERSEK